MISKKSQIDKGAWHFVRKVNYHETDAMGVVHHTHYLRFYEEARVQWIRDSGIEEFHFPHCDVHWAVIAARTTHPKPAYFDQTLEIFIQVTRERLKLGFQYATFPSSSEDLVSLGETWLVPVNSAKKPVKIAPKVKDAFERKKWTETWL